jgi:hypothetical protein
MDHQQSTPNKHDQADGRTAASVLIDREQGLAYALGILAAFAPEPRNPFHVLTLAEAWRDGREMRAGMTQHPMSGRHSHEYLKAVA